MPCDGKNPNCDRRRELLAQLKCLVSSMDRKKPCEWDEPPCPPPTCCPVSQIRDEPPCCSPVKACKSFELRGGIMYRCECIRRNGLQDRCMMFDCMGRPECMTKLYPVCGPGRAALLKLTDLGDAEVALKKFYCADQARENALAAYCRLTCGNTCAGPPCPPPCPAPPCCPSSGDQHRFSDNRHRNDGCSGDHSCPPPLSRCPPPCQPSCPPRCCPPACPPSIRCCSVPSPPPCYIPCMPCPPPCPPPCLPCMPCCPPLPC